MGHPTPEVRASRSGRTRPHVLVLAGIAAMVVLGALFVRLERPEPHTLAREELAYQPPTGNRVPVRNLSGAAIDGPDPSTPEAPTTEFDRALGPPRWHPRAPGEWDGMLVNLNVTPPCESPAGCGMARACKSGKCMPCEADVECASGESCVLDHCVRSANVSCRQRADCQSRSVCILSGYSSGVRGNEDMRAYCLALESGAERLPAAPDTPPEKDTRTKLPDDELLKAAENARQ
jgi:hypothetical protein